MALDLPLFDDALPAHVEGTIDGIVPVRLENHGDSWSLHIGAAFRHQEPHDLPPARRTGLAMTPSIYNAVARYRNAGRGQALAA